MNVSETVMGTPVLDALARPLRSLRVSVTDRCNLRCQYCMPEEEYTWLPHEEILTFEEITRLADALVPLGVEKVRLTGGEPLLRRGLNRLVRSLACTPGIRDLALTTNGVLLAAQAPALKAAGLSRVTVSLDTLRPDRFRALSRRDLLPQVLDGLRAARAAGLKLKINAVIVRGFNQDELADLLECGRQVHAEVRFIEYMDVGGATRWSMQAVVSGQEMLAALAARYGRPEPIGMAGDGGGSAPATRYQLPDGTRFGIIASVTRPFCSACDRARLTTDGMLFLCLYAQKGIDLKRLLRSGASREQIQEAVSRIWASRADRGAEERLHLPSRGVFLPVEELRKDPHREMHTLGG
jgi:cyclic pyranopterin phosphate synthase